MLNLIKYSLKTETDILKINALLGVILVYALCLFFSITRFQLCHLYLTPDSSLLHFPFPEFLALFHFICLCSLSLYFSQSTKLFLCAVFLSSFFYFSQWKRVLFCSLILIYTCKHALLDTSPVCFSLASSLDLYQHQWFWPVA